MQKKTYGDKQREAQQLKKQEALRAIAMKQSSPTPDPSKDTAAKKEKPLKTDKRVRRPA